MNNIDLDNSREWAAQAYALLKKRQEEQKQELIDISNKDNVTGQSKTIAEPE